jgi:protocatechuate 3,4-dioxygenase beta subunit
MKLYRYLWIFVFGIAFTFLLSACGLDGQPQITKKAVTEQASGNEVSPEVGNAEVTVTFEAPGSGTSTSIAPAGQTLTGEARSCEPTQPDSLGPFYEAGAPVRDRVGEGYVLRGSVLSVEGCQEIAGAQVELWLAGPDGEYRDDYRATLFSGDAGEYRFESHFPPPYQGRPSHIHIRVTAPGYQELVTQHYPEEGDEGANFDLVLLPIQ